MASLTSEAETCTCMPALIQVVLRGPISTKTDDITSQLLHSTLYVVIQVLIHCGQLLSFVYISAVAHAALWKQISSIVGSVVSFHSMW